MAQYVEVQAGLIDHPKTKRLARALGIPAVYVVGHLVALWTWTMDYAPNGDLSRQEAFDIADGAKWPGDPDQFVEALLACGVSNGSGFIERNSTGSLVIHDWYQYGGKILIKRFYDTFRKRHNRVPTEYEIAISGIFPAGMMPIPEPTTSSEIFQRKQKDSDVEQSRAEQSSVDKSRAEQSNAGTGARSADFTIASDIARSLASSSKDSLPALAYESFVEELTARPHIQPSQPVLTELDAAPSPDSPGVPNRKQHPEAYVSHYCTRHPHWRPRLDARIDEIRSKKHIEHLWPLKATIIAGWVKDPTTAPAAPLPQAVPVSRAPAVVKAVPEPAIPTREESMARIAALKAKTDPVELDPVELARVRAELEQREIARIAGNGVDSA